MNRPFLLVVAVMVGAALTLVPVGTPAAHAEALWEQEAKLTSPEFTQFDWSELGSSVALAGTTAVAGAPSHTHSGGASFTGAAHVFSLGSEGWAHSQELLATDRRLTDWFGTSVAIGGDTIAVGAPGTDDPDDSSGSVYIFVRSSPTWTWTQHQKLLASDRASWDTFGAAVALSGDTLVVGAPQDDDGGEDSGSVYVFVRSGGVWSQDAKLTTDEASHNLGIEVAVVGDTVVASTLSSAAYVFTRSGEGWQEQRLVAFDGATGNGFGQAVAISSETVAVGAPADSDNGAYSGAVYMFTWTPVGYLPEEKVTASDGVSHGYFGGSVALSGRTMAVGSLENTPPYPGSAYIFAYSSSTSNWRQDARLTPTDGQGEGGIDFGESVAVSGERVLVGAPRDHEYGMGAGAAYIFRSQAGSIVIEKQTLPDQESGSFDFVGDVAGLLSDGESIAVAVAPGTYISTETAISGWSLIDISCDDANSSGDMKSRRATFRVEARETVTCTFTNAKDGSIVVAKETVPDGDSTSFNFSGDVSGSLSDGESLAVPVAPGTYTSTEVAVAGWSLIDISCDDDNSSIDLKSRRATFQVEAGETVRCTFTNNAGSAIVVEKETLPDGDPTSFNFSGDVSGSIRDGETVLVVVPPGTYTSTEALVAGWSLTGISCDDSDSTWDVDTRTATFQVGPNETVTCRFTNAKHGSITVEKQTLPDQSSLPFDDQTVFDFTGDIEGPFRDNMSGTEAVPPGTYQVTEELPAGWALDHVTCNDANSYGTVATRTVTFLVEPGEAVHCTLTNVSGTIVVEKQTLPDGDPTSFLFGGDVSGALRDGESLSVQVAPGTYTSTESVVAGWSLASISCDDSDSTGNARTAVFRVDAGETVTCTFTNTQQGTQLGPKLMAWEGEAGDLFGYAVATDSNRLVVGAWRHDVGGDDSGAVFVYKRSGSGWLEEARLTAPGGVAGDNFGVSVALSGDWLAVGAWGADALGDDAGAVYVFEYDSTAGWGGPLKLTASDGAAGDFFGAAVALSGDRLVVGAHGDDDAGSGSGAAYVFDWSVSGPGGPLWLETVKLAASDGVRSDGFGRSVALSPDRVVVGASGHDAVAPNAGAAYVFTQSPTGWDEEKLTASDGQAGDEFGRSLSVSLFPELAGSDTLVVGAFGDDDRGEDAGAAYVFTPSTLPTGGWEELKVTASDGGAGDEFGWSVAHYGDLAVVGAHGDDDRASDAGAAYVFERSGTGWRQAGKTTVPGGAEGDRFGYAVATWDGTVAVGSHGDDARGVDAGAAWVYRSTDTGTIVVEKETEPVGSADSFVFSGHAAGVIGDGETLSVGWLLPGTHSATEAVLSGWSLTRIQCDDEDSTGDVGSHTATFRVAVAETVRCAFTNTSDSVPPGLVFVPSEPRVCFDTHNLPGGPSPVLAGSGQDFQVTGTSDHTSQGGFVGGCNVPDSAVAVYLNLVAREPEGGGNLRVDATDASGVQGGVVNYASLSPAMNNSNALPVEVSDTGGVNVFVNSSATNVRGVALGYFTLPSLAPDGLVFVPVEPRTCFDTHNEPGGPSPQLAGTGQDFQVSGITDHTSQGGFVGGCNIPVEAEAVVLNLIAREPEGGGNLRIDDTDAGSVQGGVVNYALLSPAMNNSNALPVGLSPAGGVNVFVNSSATNVRGVALGYYAPQGTPGGLLFNPSTPRTCFDTHNEPGGPTPQLAGTGQDFQVTGTGDHTAQGGFSGGCNVPEEAEAVVINLIAREPEGGGNLRIDDTNAGGVQGGVVNYALLAPPMNNSNALPVGVSPTGGVNVFTNSSATNVRGVALGYYTPEP